MKAILCALLLVLATPAWAEVTASFTVHCVGADQDLDPADGYLDCPAPAVVRFDARGTTSTNVDNEFTTLLASWDYGDPDGGRNPLTWDQSWQSGLSRNTDTDLLGGHLYWPDSYPAGQTYRDYTVTLTACEPDGTTCDTAERTVRVLERDTYFEDKTRCVSRSGLFLGCPLDTDDDGVCELNASQCVDQSGLGAGDFDAGLGTEGVGGNRDGWMTLLECGELFVNDDSALVMEDCTDSFCHLGAFGGCEDNADLTGLARVSTTNSFSSGAGDDGAVASFVCANGDASPCAGGWLVYGIKFEGDGTDPGVGTDADLEPSFGFESSFGQPAPHWWSVAFLNTHHVDFPMCWNTTDNDNRVLGNGALVNSRLECSAGFGHPAFTNDDGSWYSGTYFSFDEMDTCTRFNANCTDVGLPWPCCTGSGTGTCGDELTLGCEGPGDPWTCCSGDDAGSCPPDVTSGCETTGDPYSWCTGDDTGTFPTYSEPTRETCGDTDLYASCSYYDNSGPPRNCDCDIDCHDRSGWRSQGMRNFQFRHGRIDDLSYSANLHQHVRDAGVHDGVQGSLIYSDNYRDIYKRSTLNRLCQNDDCNSDGTAGDGFTDVLFQREHYVLRNDIDSSRTWGIGSDNTVLRGNVYEYRGLAGSHDLVRTETHAGATPDGTRIYNNTVFVEDSISSFEFSTGSSALNFETCGNLFYGPNASSVDFVHGSGDKCAEGDNYDGSGDVETTLFAGSIPAAGSTSISDFALGASSGAIGAGFEFPLYNSGLDGQVLRDATLRCRTDGDLDAGAHEATTTACHGYPDPVCGDGSAQGTEECDDGGTSGGDGCSATCLREAGYACTGSPSVCAPRCGDSLIVSPEECDDGNELGLDGCDAACEEEVGWSCAGTPSVCTETCNDGFIVGDELCDDDGRTAGCSDTCDSIEAGWTCTPYSDILGSECVPICGDGVVITEVFPTPSDDCDNGSADFGDGCSASCRTAEEWSAAGVCAGPCVEEAGWSCSGEPSTCSEICGDGLIVGGESCDDGGTTAGDGCSDSCVEETGYDCVGEPSVCTPLPEDLLLPATPRSGICLPR